MGIWDLSVMRKRRILPGVAGVAGVAETSFGVGVEVLRHGKLSQTGGYYNTVDLAESGDIYLYASPQVSKVDADNVRVFASNFGPENLEAAYNSRSDRVVFSGEYSAFYDASNGTLETFFENQTNGAVCADPLSGDFFTGGQSEIRRYTDDATLSNTGSRSGESARAVAIDASGAHFFVMYDDICRVGSATLAVEDSFDAGAPLQTKMLATNGEILAFMTTDSFMHCYTSDFSHVWSREMVDYETVTDLEMDIYGDVYLAGEGAGNSARLRRYSGKSGELVIDIEAAAAWKLPMRTDGITGVSVNSAGLVAACSDEYYRVLAQS